MATTTAHDLITRWRNDPLAFISDCGLGTPFPAQQRIAHAVRDHRVVLVASGNMVGKDWIAARLVLWYWITHPPSTVITTAPRLEQLQEILWAELRGAYMSSRVPLGGRLLPRAMRLSAGEHWKVLGTVSNDVTKLSGYHNRHVMVVIDEATGVEQAEFEAFLSLAPSPHDRILALFNPTRRDCYVYRLWCSGAAECITIPSTDSPNFDGRPPERYIHGLATPEWADEIARIYGRQSNYYLSHVLGLWPLAESDETIPVEWLDAAMTRPPEYSPDTQPPGEVYMGVDLGEGVGADNSVIVVRNETGVLAVWRSRRARATQVIEKAEELADEYRVPDANIYIDVVSSHDVWRYWRDRGRMIRGYNGGERAHDGRRFANRRTESYWRLRERLAPDAPRPFGFGAMDYEDRHLLRAELAALRHEVLSDRRIALQPKRKLRRLLGRSPDLADALAMTFSHPLHATYRTRRARSRI